ncbi:MAG: SH3 domain-containing protein [Sphingomonas sp.]|uniref:SH3 domain-containing protein n=1 Tax=Sphingomonas sp. TaxID=28214 RepID=UPI001B2CA3DB|nr:SH3 domain-containing protein [Sphingomonas sp.]MBO9623290.1 SH3 domain-containing protein [Sphingomonas sp.]
MDAVRRDLADVRLAERVFAPHYAAPMPRALVRGVALRASRDADSEVLAQLQQGDLFEVLEFAGGNAWGVAPGAGLVGYVDADALHETAQ